MAFKERIVGELHGTSVQADQVASQYRDGIHVISTDGLMRRMVKEDLKTFDGRRCSPSAAPTPSRMPQVSNRGCLVAGGSP